MNYGSEILRKILEKIFILELLKEKLRRN